MRNNKHHVQTPHREHTESKKSRKISETIEFTEIKELTQPKKQWRNQDFRLRRVQTTLTNPRLPHCQGNQGAHRNLGIHEVGNLTSRQ